MLGTIVIELSSFQGHWREEDRHLPVLTCQSHLSRARESLSGNLKCQFVAAPSSTKFLPLCVLHFPPFGVAGSSDYQASARLWLLVLGSSTEQRLPCGLQMSGLQQAVGSQPEHSLGEAALVFHGAAASPVSSREPQVRPSVK